MEALSLHPYELGHLNREVDKQPKAFLKFNKSDLHLVDERQKKRLDLPVNAINIEFIVIFINNELSNELCSKLPKKLMWDYLNLNIFINRKSL